MRCDLHVHSWYSGPAAVPVLEHVGRECYSPPLQVYERARRRGMDLVTLTDHDTIEGAVSIAHLPGTFVSEERRVVASLALAPFLPLIPLFTLRAFQEAFGWPALPSERPSTLGAPSLGEAA